MLDISSGIGRQFECEQPRGADHSLEATAPPTGLVYSASL